jgi:hypothetical protein
LGQSHRAENIFVIGLLSILSQMKILANTKKNGTPKYFCRYTQISKYEIFLDTC